MSALLLLCERAFFISHTENIPEIPRGDTSRLASNLQGKGIFEGDFFQPLEAVGAAACSGRSQKCYQCVLLQY
ncbi:hypothetical protein ACFSE1_14115 [Rhizobium helianthi]|uniref:Uncharacterized protein n=1 Tax=Rhizobium helianthi TaxID=1132695 RepID=A0ABW4M5W8_9HYPH